MLPTDTTSTDFPRPSHPSDAKRLPIDEGYIALPTGLNGPAQQLRRPVVSGGG